MAKPVDNIYIHAGLPKTGSSFLQSALESLELQNAFANTSYPVLNPNADFQFIRSGNGWELAQLLKNAPGAEFDKDGVKTAFNDLLNKRRSNKENMLISSESFVDVSPERFAYLKGIMLEACNNVKIIIYVRPFAPWAWSLYNQGVKRHNFTFSFEEWADRLLVKYSEIVLSHLFSLGLDIVALPFRRSNLLPLLLEALSEDIDLARLIPDAMVNRSLTEVETNLLKIANEVFKDQAISSAVSDFLIKTSPYTETAPLPTDTAKIAEKYLPKVLDILDGHNTEVAQRIKELFLQPCELADQKSDLVYDKQEVHNTVRLILTAIFDDHAKSNRRLSRLNEVAASFKKSRTHFDPIHYLLLNRDVLDAGIDPTTHFENFGKKENRFTCLTD